MSFQWNQSNTNYTMNPGSIENATDDYNNAERLLSDFHTQLMDHKKKQSNLIQNFHSSNSKFDEVTHYFMSQINPILKATADRYQAQNQMLNEQIIELKNEVSSYRKERDILNEEKQAIALEIINFCESDINPLEFELFVGALFASLGYRIEHNGRTHDGGIDLIVRHPLKGKGVVQVKQYRNNTKVTEPQIRDLYGAMSAKQEVEYAIMVVLNDCTKEAKTWPNRENVTNLKIWTHRELVSLLQEKPITVLIEFVKLLMDRHEHEMNGMIHSNTANYVTPRNPNKTTTTKRQISNRQQVQQSSSRLSSAKKKNKWNNFKFANGVMNDKENEGNNSNSNSVKQQDSKQTSVDIKSDTYSGEASPHSSNESSLFIDEGHSDDDHLRKKKNKKNVRRHRNKNNIKQDLKKINNAFDSSSLLWSLNKNNNMNKPRRARRKWKEGDNLLLLNSIQQFGVNWNETSDQWNKIFAQCTFSQQFALIDVKKHYARVLKPKILSQSLSRSKR